MEPQNASMVHGPVVSSTLGARQILLHLPSQMPWDSDSPDEDLMLAYRDGDAGAFELLYGRHRSGVFRFLLRQCGSAGEAEELLQDVWMNLIRARLQYTVQAKFTTYLYRVAHNRLIDHYRRRPQGVPVSFEDEQGPELDSVEAAAHERPDARYDAGQKIDRFRQLLDELPEAQREAFVMQEEAGMSLAEIAVATGVRRETAKSRLRYAMAKLRLGMKDLL